MILKKELTSDNSVVTLCPRGSVGAVLKNKDGAYLVLYRKEFPKGLAFVAGHKDAGEQPHDALIREMREETGIDVKDYEVLIHEKFPNPCKSGFQNHEWWVYEITDWSGEPELKESEKHEFVMYMPKEEITAYVQKNDVDPAWGKFIFPLLSLKHKF